MKYVVSKKLGLDQSEWDNFGLFVLEKNRFVKPILVRAALKLHQIIIKLLIFN